eukprot:ANDGO_03254.mRNA.1 hypothetical protein
MDVLLPLFERNAVRELDELLSRNSKRVQQLVDFRSATAQNTVLMLACMHGQHMMVEVILKHVCLLFPSRISTAQKFESFISTFERPSVPSTVAFVEDFVLSRNAHGDTAAHFAASSGSTDCIVALGALGSIPIRNNGGMTPFMVCIRLGHLGVFLGLISQWSELRSCWNADSLTLSMLIRMCDHQGDNLFHFAVRSGRWRIARELRRLVPAIQWDDPTMANRNGETPKHIFETLWTLATDVPVAFPAFMNETLTKEAQSQTATVRTVDNPDEPADEPVETTLELECETAVPERLSEMGIRASNVLGYGLHDLSAGQLEVLQKFLSETALQISDERVARVQSLLEDDSSS